VNYDNSLVVTITVTCNLWEPSSGDNLFSCGAIYLPPHFICESLGTVDSMCFPWQQQTAQG